MRNAIRRVAGGVWLGCVVISVPYAALAAGEERHIVRVAEGQDPVAVAKRMGLTPDQVFTHALNGFSVLVPKGASIMARRDPGVFPSKDAKSGFLRMSPTCPGSSTRPSPPRPESAGASTALTSDTCLSTDDTGPARREMALRPTSLTRAFAMTTPNSEDAPFRIRCVWTGRKRLQRPRHPRRGYHRRRDPGSCVRSPPRVRSRSELQRFWKHHRVVARLRLGRRAPVSRRRASGGGQHLHHGWREPRRRCGREIARPRRSHRGRRVRKRQYRRVQRLPGPSSGGHHRGSFHFKRSALEREQLRHLCRSVRTRFQRPIRKYGESSGLSGLERHIDGLPHVAGAAALYMENIRKPPVRMREGLAGLSTQGAVDLSRSGNNNLLYILDGILG